MAQFILPTTVYSLLFDTEVQERETRQYWSVGHTSFGVAMLDAKKFSRGFRVDLDENGQAYFSVALNDADFYLSEKHPGTPTHRAVKRLISELPVWQGEENASA